MADNPIIDNGTLTDYTVSADEGSGGYVQRVKLAYSADGSETHVSADADGLLVNLGTNNDVTVTGTVTANAGTGTMAVSAASLPLPSGASTLAEQQSQTTHLSTIASGVDGVEGLLAALTGTVSGTELQVDVVTMPTTTVQDGGGSLTVDNAGTFAVQVDGAALTALQLIDNPVVVDDAAFTPATTSVMMAGFEYDDTSPDTVNEGDAGAARMSSRRELYVQVRDAAGNERGLNVDASGNIGVSSIASALPAGTNAIGKLAANTGVDIGDVDVTSVVPGTSATSLGKAVDAAAGASDVGVSILAVRDDALTTLTPADGDYVPLRTTSTGALWVEATAQGHEYLEDAAHTSGDYGSLILGVRNDSSLTNVAGADGDYTFLATDALGRVQTTRRQPIVLTWTPTLDTSAYASGDSLYTTVTTLSNAHFRNGGTLMVDTITVLDKSTPSGANNPAPIDILFFSASVTPSTVNTASGISDADMANCIGFVSVAQYTTNSANSFGQRTNIGLPLKLGASTTSLYVACIVRGTPTYASDSLVFTLYGYPDA